MSDQTSGGFVCQTCGATWKGAHSCTPGSGVAIGAACLKCGSLYCPTPGACVTWSGVAIAAEVDPDLAELAKMVEAMKATKDKATALRYLISRFWTGGVANLIECAK